MSLHTVNADGRPAVIAVDQLVVAAHQALALVIRHVFTR
ncbi:cellulose synthase operon C domain protein [Candidatus Erwinia dacicola]|uniref:Cellulose synthase operon C domain protein n=1 Tax=Candidatus Erwinia dacicola TaxID=252393 RepID=A0A328TM99_9GAMM|nr:cellulose synthase operon C domain protein [Candidatus Erwinia dacicola]